MARGSAKREWSAFLRFVEELQLRLGGWRPKTVTGAVIRAIVGRGVISRRELVELTEKIYEGKGRDADPRSTIRVILHYLRDAGLVYVRRHCRECYIVSMPWLLFVESTVGDKWVELLKRKAPDISQKEVGELRKWVKLSKLSDREIEKLDREDRELARKLKRVRMFAEWRLKTLKYMFELRRAAIDALPDTCFEPVVEYVRGSFGDAYLTREAAVALIGRWYLECYVPVLYEYIPFLLDLLAGMAYSYATGYSIKQHIADTRRVTSLWLEKRYRGDYRFKPLGKLVSETVSRLANLVEHLLQSVPKNLREFIEGYGRELKDRGVRRQELYNSVSIIGRFLSETFLEFYIWIPYILNELQTLRSVSSSHRT